MASTRSLLLVLAALGSCSGASEESPEPSSVETETETPDPESGNVARSNSYQMVNQSVSMVGTVRSTPSSEGGVTVPLGGGAAQLRLDHDPVAGRLEVDVLDGSGAVPVRIRQAEIAVRITAGEEAFDLVLPAAGNQATGEAAGQSSSFSKRDPRLRELETFHVDIASVTIGDREFRQVGVDW